MKIQQQNNQSQLSILDSAAGKSIRIENLANSKKNKNKKDQSTAKALIGVVGFEHDYLSATDPEDYQDRISLKNLSKEEQ